MPTKKLPTTAKVVAKKIPRKKTSNKNTDGLPLSVVIRKRIEAQKARFHANDNIAQFIQPGELEGLVDEVAEKMQAVLESLVIDTENKFVSTGLAKELAQTTGGKYYYLPKRPIKR